MIVDRPTASERIREARRAWQIREYEDHGWPLAVVQRLNTDPTLTLHDALDWYSEPVKAVA